MKKAFILLFSLLLISQIGFGSENMNNQHTVSSEGCITDQWSANPGNDSSIKTLTDVVDSPDVNIDPDDLKQAKEALKKFLGNDEGEKAVKKLMDKSDKNKDKAVNMDELVGFLEHIELGNYFTRSSWAEGIMNGFGNSKKGFNGPVLDREDAVVMLQYLELY